MVASYYATNDFEQGKAFIENLYVRRGKEASDRDKRHWQRIARLNATCKGNLQFYVQIPDVKEQAFIDQAKDYHATVAGNQKTITITKGQSDSPVTGLSDGVALQILQSRSNAVVIYTIQDCRLGLNAEIKAQAGDHNEILYVMELGLDDCLPLLRKLGSNLTDKDTFAELPSYWKNVFVDSLGFEMMSSWPVQDGLVILKLKAGNPMKTDPSVRQVLESKQDITYPTDDITVPETTSGRELIIDGKYEGTTPEEKWLAFNSDYKTVTQIPDTLEQTEIQELKQIHANMVGFAKENVSDPRRWRLLGEAEGVLLPLSIQSGSTGKQWFEENIRNNTGLQLLGSMREYAAGSGMQKEEVAFEKRNWATLSPDEQKKSRVFALESASSAEDILSLDPQNFEELNLLQNRMASLRESQWPKAIQRMSKRQDDALRRNQNSTEESRDAIGKLLVERRALFEKQALAEKQYSDLLAKKFNTQLPNDQQQAFVKWYNASQQSLKDKTEEIRILQASSVPSSSASSTQTTPATVTQNKLLATVIANPVTLPTVTKDEKDAVGSSLSIFVNKDKEERNNQIDLAKEQFAIANKLYGEIKTTLTSLEGKVVTARLPEYEAAVKGVAKCYNQSQQLLMTFQQFYVERDTRTSNEFKQIVETTRKSNLCLASYQRVFEELGKKAEILEKSEAESKVAAILAQMKGQVALADRALNEAKIVATRRTAQAATRPLNIDLGSIVTQIEEGNRNAHLTVEGFEAGIKTATEEDAKKQLETLTKDVREVIRKRLSLDENMLDSMEAMYMAQQLRGSQINVEQAQRSAEASAKAAQEELARLQQAKIEQNELLRRANVHLNPLKTIGVNRDELEQKSQRMIQEQRFVLQTLLDELQIAITNNNEQNNIDSLLDKISAFEETVVHVKELEDLVQQSKTLRQSAQRILIARNAWNPEEDEGPTQHVTPENNDDAIDRFHDAADNLEEALNEGKITLIKKRLKELNEAEDELSNGLSLEFKQWESIKQRANPLKAQAKTMLAKSQTKQAPPKKKSVKRSK